MWKVVAEDGFLNATYIFPTQQRDVAAILSRVRQMSEVRRVIVFGSSVTSACNPWSDIDIYFELDTDVALNVVPESVGVSVDKWTNFDVDERLRKEILETGVVVYER